MSNKGIIVSGGSFNAGQVAVGDGASVRSDVRNYGAGEQRQLLAALDALSQELRAARLPGDRHEAVAGTVALLKEEARSPSPDRSAIEKGLAFITKAAASVTGVAGAVKVVKEVVGLLL
jgi:hypothetical protein